MLKHQICSKLFDLGREEEGANSSGVNNSRVCFASRSTSHTHVRTYVRTHARMHACTHACMHARTYTLLAIKITDTVGAASQSRICKITVSKNPRAPSFDGPGKDQRICTLAKWNSEVIQSFNKFVRGFFTDFPRHVDTGHEYNFKDADF